MDDFRKEKGCMDIYVLFKFKVILSTNIHNENIKTKYIPSYIFENEGKKAEIAKVKQVSGKFTMFKY